MCEKVNPRMQISRAFFSSVTPREIQHALATLGQPRESEADAVDARSEIDLRIGSAFTRLQTQYLQNTFSFFSKRTISYGPCQFPVYLFYVFINMYVFFVYVCVCIF
jgi:DNA topoisomerase-3